MTPLRTTLAIGAIIAAVLVGIAVAMRSGENAPSNHLGGALIVADRIPACGFPPLTERFAVDHRELVRVARCLNRRGYLSDAGLFGIVHDPAYTLRGSWDGTPGKSGISWRTKGGVTFTTVALDHVGLTWRVVAGYIGLGALVAMLVWWVRLRRRNRSTAP